MTTRPAEHDDVFFEEEPNNAFDFDPKRFLQALRRYWALVVLFATLGGIVAFIRFSITEKEFRAVSTMQIERRRFSAMAMGQANWVEDWWNMEYYPTQYRLLRSRGMAERVILYLRLHQDPGFTPRPIDLGGRAGLDPGELAPEDAAELAKLAGRVQAGLTVRPVAETQLVELVYVSTDPEMAARIANGYSEVFIDWTSETRSTTVRKASSFLTSQIEQIRKEIDELQRQRNAMTTETEFALDPEGEALVERRQMLEEQLNSAIGRRVSAEAAYREMVDSGGSRAASAANPEARRVRDEVAGLEAEYEAKLETFRPEWPAMVRLRDEIEEKREQMRRLQSDSAQISVADARSEFQKAQRQEAFLKAELAKVAEDIRAVNSEALDYINLRMQIDTQKELLRTLVERQSETAVASRVQGEEGSNARIVDRAVVPEVAFRPVLGKDLGVFILGGTLFAIGGIALLTFLDRTIKSPDELEKVTGLPTLTVIPDISERGRRKYGKGYGYSSEYGYSYGYGYSQPSSERTGLESAYGKGNPKITSADIELLPHQHPRLAISEAYRSLRTGLLLSSATELRRIAVTSAEPGEGKTSTSTNLAIVMAQLGRRVLIVDADLRRPRIHKVFSLSNRAGLVTYLTGPRKDHFETQETGVPNLSVLTSGPIPPNPSELLASDRMAEFLTEARKDFDLLIIDTPPVLPVADAVIVGTQVDGVVVCSLAGRLTRDDARACRERLNYEHIRIFGTVLNRYRRLPGMPYDRKYHYYGVYEETPARKSSETAA